MSCYPIEEFFCSSMMICKISWRVYFSFSGPVKSSNILFVSSLVRPTAFSSSANKDLNWLLSKTKSSLVDSNFSRQVRALPSKSSVLKSKIFYTTCVWMITVYGNTGYGVSSPGIQNQKDFCLKINISKGNFWILRIGIMGRCQKSQNLTFKVNFICQKS